MQGVCPSAEVDAIQIFICTNKNRMLESPADLPLGRQEIGKICTAKDVSRHANRILGISQPNALGGTWTHEEVCSVSEHTLEQSTHCAILPRQCRRNDLYVKVFVFFFFMCEKV